MHTHEPQLSVADTGDLGGAAAAAVARSRAEAESLLLDVEITATELHLAVDGLIGWEAPDGPLAEFRVIADQLARGSVGDFDQQLSALDSFNIVFFGRTGAGKSSLIAAMARLDGSGVSRGESDWTESASSVHWQGVRLYDTPGINGWGRLTTRAELERRARDEVKKADVVVLCFDSLSQQATEFQKVADWVLDFDKPVIVALNTKNPRWGMPGIPATGRQSMSQAVRQHVENIQDGLKGVGLHGVPVVAISAQRALDARAAEPYQGPYPLRREARLSRHSKADLLRWSNVPTLEQLIIEMVENGGVDLRVASLREAARSSHRNVAVELERLQAQATEAVGIVEATIDAELRVLGYPDVDRRREHLTDPRAADDLLTELERLRGEPFGAPVQGSLDRHAESLLAAHLKGLETESVRNAEEEIKRAFENGCELTSAEFGAAVYDEAQIEVAAAAVWEDAQTYVESKLRLASADGGADARFLARMHATEGGAGRGWRGVGSGLKIGGLAGGVASTLFLVFATTNPVGWVLGFGAALLGWGGKRALKKAEADKLNARSTSLARARLAVHSSYKELHERVIAEITDRIWTRSAPALNSTLAMAISLHLLCADLERLRLDAQVRGNSIPERPDVARVIRRALDAVLAERGTSGAAGILWGENWLTEVGVAPGGEPHPRGQDALQAREQDLRPALDEIIPEVTLSQLEPWIAALKSQNDHPEIQAIGQGIAVPSTPGVALIGDYNTGKTSLIKRLLAESGRPIPPDLIVGGRPTTREARIFELDGLRIIDTPGFQSGDRGDEAEALRALEQASVVLLLFQPNLVVGDRDLLKVITDGDAATWPRGATCLAVVNRVDELGVDPDDSPADFTRLCDRKRVELVQALARNGLPMSQDRVIFVAADPHGMVGDRVGATMSDYEGHMHWDGVGSLMQGLQVLASKHSERARASAALLAALGNLQQHTVILNTRLETAWEQTTELNDLDRVLQRSIVHAGILRREVAHRAEETVRTHAQQLYDDLLAARTEHEIEASLAEFETWWESPTLQAELQLWAEDAEKRINTWATETSSTILRQFQRRSFQNAFTDIAVADLDALWAQGNSVLGMRLAHEGLGHLVRTFGKRNAVYKVGKLLGHKFRPWEATQIAGKVSRLGPWLAGLGVALDAFDWINSVRKENEREAARRSADEFFRNSVNAVVSHLVSSDSESSPVHHLDEQIQMLVEARTSIAAQRGAAESASIAAQEGIRITQEFMADGQGLLTSDNQEEAVA